MNKKILLIIFSILLLAVLVLPLSQVEAKPTLKDAFKTSDNSNADNLDTAAKGAGYDTNQTSPNTIISTIIQVALSFLGIIFLGLMVYGGYIWMTDRGNSDNIEKAKKLITAAVIGLIIVMAAYAISFLVIKQIGGTTLTDDTSTN
jgi:cbb3-type cytochrome oxidase subunit 3